MRWLFIIDPIEKLNQKIDTTLPIMREASDRMINVFYCTVDGLFLESTVKGNVKRIIFRHDKHIIERPIIQELSTFDIIFMRKDPPYDLRYHYTTNLLSLAETLVVNPPVALRDYNEKLIIFNFPELIPDTIISYDKSQILSFIKRHNNIAIIKSLDSYQGKSVRKITAKDISIIEEYTSNSTLPIMAQEFLPNIKKGDKRIIILGGNAIAFYNRIPAEGSYLSSTYAGATPVPTTLSWQEQKIVEATGKFLIEKNIHLAGIDIVDGRLTEINITCPSGIGDYNRITKSKKEKEIVDYFERLTKRSY